MKRKNLIMIMVAMFVFGVLMSGYMLRNGFAKADSAPVTEVQIDDGFVVVLDNDAETIQNFNDSQSQDIAEAHVESVKEAQVDKENATDDFDADSDDDVENGIVTPNSDAQDHGSVVLQDGSSSKDKVHN